MTISAEEVCKTISLDWKYAHKHNDYMTWCLLRSGLRAMRTLMITHNETMEEVDETDILINLLNVYITETQHDYFYPGEAA